MAVEFWVYPKKIYMEEIYKPMILRKLELSTKFLYKILYTRKLVLGVGLIALSIIFDILALILCVGHNCRDSEVIIIINILEENAWLQYSFSNITLSSKVE